MNVVYKSLKDICFLRFYIAISIENKRVQHLMCVANLVTMLGWACRTTANGVQNDSERHAKQQRMACKTTVNGVQNTSEA